MGSELGLVALVGVSRVHSNSHYITDVFAGAAAGLSIVTMNLIQCRPIGNSVYGTPVDVYFSPLSLTICY